MMSQNDVFTLTRKSGRLISGLALLLVIAAALLVGSCKHGSSSSSGDPAPTITGVTVTPSTLIATRGESKIKQFTADVTGTGNFDKTVIWGLSGVGNDGASREVLSKFTQAGVLTINAGEDAALKELKFTAVSAADPAKSAVATITFRDASEVYDSIQLVGINGGNTPVNVTANEDGLFTYDKVISEAEGSAMFNIKLIKQSDTKWFAPGVDGTLALGYETPLGDPVAAEPSVKWKINGAGTYTITLDPYNKTLKLTGTLNNPALAPTVTGVTVNGPAKVDKGAGGHQYTAGVTVTNGAPQAVTWSVARESGNLADGTAINGTGILTVAAAEAVGNLIVTAASNFDTTKKGSMTVIVQEPASVPTVYSIAVSPKTASVEQGKTQAFIAVVEKSGFGDTPATVTWSLTGNDKAGTNIEQDGTLRIARDEPVGVNKLTIKAEITTTASGTKSDTATVTVTQGTLGALWIVGTSFTGGWTEPTPETGIGTAMTLEADGTFTWTGNVPATPSYFRFSPDNKTNWGDLKYGDWYVPADGANSGVVLGAAGNPVKFQTNDVDFNWVITNPSTYKITVNPQTLSFTIDDTRGTAGGITVTVPNPVTTPALGFTPPANLVIHKTGAGDRSLNFTTSNADYTYSWSVDGGTPVDGATFNVNAANYAVGGHSVVLIAKKDGVPWSPAPIAFTVEAN
ncbi:hypothetical protein AGMMS50267_07980 [Spirochaetia bacterium]|nr:hypothetical protein AGMMS50267_07980 [Spirochaetia bacterium]